MFRAWSSGPCSQDADVSRLVGMADEVDSKSIDGNIVWVQVPQPALLGRGEDREVSDHLPVFFFVRRLPKRRRCKAGGI